MLSLLAVLPRVLYIFGLVVSAVIGRILSKTRVFRGDWGWFIAATAIAEVLACLLAVIVELLLPHERAPNGPWLAPANFSPIALFVGGSFGGLLIIAVLCLLRRIGMVAALGWTLLGTVSGGILAIFGWALASSLGAGLWRFLDAQPSIYGPAAVAQLIYSVHLVWPTGMALVIALSVRDHGAAGKIEQQS